MITLWLQLLNTGPQYLPPGVDPFEGTYTCTRQQSRKASEHGAAVPALYLPRAVQLWLDSGAAHLVCFAARAEGPPGRGGTHM